MMLQYFPCRRGLSVRDGSHCISSYTRCSIASAAAPLNPIVDELTDLVHQSQDAERFEIWEPGTDLAGELADVRVGNCVRSVGRRSPDNDTGVGIVDQDVAWGSVVQEDNSAAWITQDCHVSQRRGMIAGVCGWGGCWRVGTPATMDGVAIGVGYPVTDLTGYDILETNGDFIHVVSGVLQSRQSCDVSICGTR
jgi:hypothetical protein